MRNSTNIDKWLFFLIIIINKTLGVKMIEHVNATLYFLLKMAIFFEKHTHAYNRYKVQRLHYSIYRSKREELNWIMILEWNICVRFFLQFFLFRFL